MTSHGEKAFSFTMALLVIETERTAECSRIVAQTAVSLALDEEYDVPKTDSADLYLAVYDRAVEIARGS